MSQNNRALHCTSKKKGGGAHKGSTRTLKNQPTKLSKFLRAIKAKQKPQDPPGGWGPGAASDLLHLDHRLPSHRPLCACRRPDG